MHVVAAGSSNPSAVTTAIIAGAAAVMGALAGGLITAGAQWGLAARTDRLDARVAKREVRTELRQIRARLESYLRILTETRYPHFPDPGEHIGQIVSDKWKAHSYRLARQLSDDGWQAVEDAYLSIERIVFSQRYEQQTRQEGVQHTTATFGSSAQKATTLIDEALLRLR
jgi:hypothetical protein